MSERDFYITPRGFEHFAENNDWLVNQFGRCSVSVYGIPGSGKDTLFAHNIALTGKPHYANIAYDYDTIISPLTLFELKDTKYDDILNQRVTPVRNMIIDGLQGYLSDSNISVSNIDNERIKAKHPGLHIYSSVRRHLNDFQLHVNGQTFERCYIIYREQCDCFIWCRRCIKFENYLLIEAITYAYRNHAAGYVLPTDSRPSDEIRTRFFLIPKDELHFETKAFRDLFYLDKGRPGYQTTLLKEFLLYETA